MNNANLSPLVRDALNPTRSVVVEACAGSGKTWLLVSRIIRLLIAGAEPSEILAITYTRKAAQEMQARLNDWLRLLATAPEEAVRAFLRERALSDAEITRALPRVRGLFELALTSRPALTINTFSRLVPRFIAACAAQCRRGGQCGAAGANLTADRGSLARLGRAIARRARLPYRARLE